MKTPTPWRGVGFNHWVSLDYAIKERNVSTPNGRQSGCSRALGLRSERGDLGMRKSLYHAARLRRCVPFVGEILVWEASGHMKVISTDSSLLTPEKINTLGSHRTPRIWILLHSRSR
jgi:hypothetical protein